MRTNVAIHEEFVVGVIGPYYAACCASDVLGKQPKAEKGDTQVPILADKTDQKH